MGDNAVMARRLDPLKKKKAKVLGANMAYVEHGTGDPIVFVHGNPTSSFLWRNVIPEVAGLGRCIAPDLIGMGDSDQIAAGRDAYRFGMHAEYLEALLGVLDIESNVVLVGHDWGGALVFDWARKNEDAVSGIAFMETLVTPATWDDWPEASQSIFRAMRSEAGEEIVLTKNVFVERILPASVLGGLSDEAMEVYRRPYRTAGESRRPTLTFPREIPIDGVPEDMHHLVSQYEQWLESTPIPKLFVDADPGFMINERVRAKIRTWPRVTEVTVPGSHFIQEDSGPEIGSAIARWIETIKAA